MNATILGRRPHTTVDLPLIQPGEKICSVDALSNGTSLKFRTFENNREVEAFLIRFQGKYFAYKNRCAHMALPLDMEDNDFFTLDGCHLICKTHGAEYEVEDGFCFSGPCYGEALEPLRVEIFMGSVVLLAT